MNAAENGSGQQGSGPSEASRRERRHFSGQQKVAIVKRHLVDGVAVSDLCEEHQILPTQFYQWQKQLFEGGAAAFETRRGATSGPTAAERQVQELQIKLLAKNEVIAELMEEHVRLKKVNGTP